MRLNQENRFLMYILALAFFSRLAIGVATRSWEFSPADNSFDFGFEMGQIAQSIASEGRFGWPEDCEILEYRGGELTSWMPPVYPYVMAAVFRIFGTFTPASALVLEFFQIVLSLLICVLLYQIGKQIFNPQTGLIAALIFSVYLPGIHFAVQKIWSTTLSSLCILMIIFILSWLAEHPHLTGGGFLGVMLGFTLLLDPVLLCVYPFAFLWLFLNAKSNRRTICSVIGVAGAALMLTLSPWVIRNYGVFGRFVPIKSNFGNELFLGNTEPATGGWRDSLIRWYDPQRDLSETERIQLFQATEVERNRTLLKIATSAIIRNPMSFFSRTSKRVGRYWTYIRPLKGFAARISLGSYLTVLALAILGLYQGGLSNSGGKLMFIFLAVVPIPYYVTIVVFFRYRFPIEPILILFAANAIWRIEIIRRLLKGLAPGAE